MRAEPRQLAQRRTTHVVAISGLSAFVAIVVAQHALQPGLSPATHEVSEYANGHPGWLMVIGFLCWSFSLAATAAIAAGTSRLASAHVRQLTTTALLVAATGILITACFATQTSAGKLPPGASLTLAGWLHDAGSGIAILALIVALVLSVLDHGGSRRYRQLSGALLTFALVSDAALLAVGPSVAGARQRVMLACAVLWQLAALGQWFTSGDGQR